MVNENKKKSTKKNNILFIFYILFSNTSCFSIIQTYFQKFNIIFSDRSRLFSLLQAWIFRMFKYV